LCFACIFSFFNFSMAMATIAVCCPCGCWPFLHFSPQSACIPYKFFTILCNCIVCEKFVAAIFRCRRRGIVFNKNNNGDYNAPVDPERHAHCPPSRPNAPLTSFNHGSPQNAPNK